MNLEIIRCGPKTVLRVKSPLICRKTFCIWWYILKIIQDIKECFIQKILWYKHL